MILCFCLFNFLFTLFISESKSGKLLRHIVCIFDFILLFSFPHPFLRRRKPSSPWQCNQNPPPWSSPHSPFMHNAYYEMTTCYIFDKDFVHVNVTLSIHYVITKKTNCVVSGKSCHWLSLTVFFFFEINVTWFETVLRLTCKESKSMLINTLKLPWLSLKLSVHVWN